MHKNSETVFKRGFIATEKGNTELIFERHLYFRVSVAMFQDEFIRAGNEN
jgi:hypothetical protein